jgi:hypothetical protein
MAPCVISPLMAWVVGNICGNSPFLGLSVITAGMTTVDPGGALAKRSGPSAPERERPEATEARVG